MSAPHHALESQQNAAEIGVTSFIYTLEATHSQRQKRVKMTCDFTGWVRRQLDKEGSKVWKMVLKWVDEANEWRDPSPESGFKSAGSGFCVNEIYNRCLQASFRIISLQ